jgi:putative FmdB family regulatory protein
VPIYQYKCECGNAVEELQGINAEHVFTCSCGKQMKRIFGGGQAIRIDFTPGFDVQAGKNFGTKRERDNFLAERNWERIKS